MQEVELCVKFLGPRLAQVSSKVRGCVRSAAAGGRGDWGRWATQAGEDNRVCMAMCKTGLHQWLGSPIDGVLSQPDPAYRDVTWCDVPWCAVPGCAMVCGTTVCRMSLPRRWATCRPLSRHCRHPAQCSAWQSPRCAAVSVWPAARMSCRWVS